MFAQVVTSLILKVKDIVIIAAEISNFLLELGYVCQVYVIVTNHINRHGKIRGRTGKKQ